MFAHARLKSMTISSHRSMYLMVDKSFMVEKYVAVIGISQFRIEIEI